MRLASLSCLALLCIVFVASSEATDYDAILAEDVANEIEFAQSTSKVRAPKATAAAKLKAAKAAAAKLKKTKLKAKKAAAKANAAAQAAMKQYIKSAKKAMSKKPAEKPAKKPAKKAAKKHYEGKGLFVPKFVGKRAWDAASAKRRKAFEKANKYFKKTHAKMFKASHEKVEKLNAKADKAQQVLYKAKERMKKKYANDDPEDFGIHKGWTKAHEKRHKLRTQGDGRNESGSYGASGCNPDKKGCKPKWYPDGAISSNAYTDKKGRYFLGSNRRRIGAGFGRRRRHDGKWIGHVSMHKVKQIIKGHDLLKATVSRRKLDQKPGVYSSRFHKSAFHHSKLLKAARHKRTVSKLSKAIAAHDHLEKQKKKAATVKKVVVKKVITKKGKTVVKKVVKKIKVAPKKKKPLPPNVHVPNVDKLTEHQKEILRATKAGVHARLTNHGQFKDEEVVKILGEENAASLGRKLKKAAKKSRRRSSRRRSSRRRRRRTAAFFFRRRRTKKMD